MIKNYLIIAWRNLQKNKIYSFINIIGLAIGSGQFSPDYALYIMDELSYDKLQYQGRQNLSHQLRYQTGRR